MKCCVKTKIKSIIFVCLIANIRSIYGREIDESGNDYKNILRFSYGNFSIDKDAGRFREDNWITDGSTGGLDWLHLESNNPDDNGYEWIFEGRAIHDYDYKMSLLMKKKDSHYIKFDFSGFRRYYDGSNESWIPSLYSLSDRFAEMQDEGLFTDRRKYNFELGLTPSEGLEVILGWKRFEKDGKEVLLSGGFTLAAGQPDFYAIPSVVNLKGITDTLYVEIAKTFAEKYNIRIRQEFEQYHDDQRTEFPRAISGTRAEQTFSDDIGYTNWRSMFMFDSFLDEKTYVTANYMYDYLNNDSSRTATLSVQGLVLLPFTNNQAGNSRRTNVGSLGYWRVDILPGLDFFAALRIEDSRTSSSSTGLLGGSPFTAASNRDEVRLGETLRLTYKGYKNTKLTFVADLEQRDLRWKENNGGADWKTDIDFTDQVYTLKATHRFNRKLKSTLRFRIKDLQRSYTNLLDDTAFYPGYLGSYRRTGNDLMLKVDYRLNSKTSGTMMYQFLQESINTKLGGKTQNLEIHRASSSLSLHPSPKLFLVSTFMLENYSLNTPANGSGTNFIAAGSSPFDFKGNYFSLLFDTSYTFNQKTSCNFSYLHTEALGTVDSAGDYAFDKIALALKYKIAKKQTVSIGYQFLNFNNHINNSFDDYKGHGAIVTYEYTF